MIKFLILFFLFTAGFNSQAIVVTGKAVTENIVSNYIIYSEVEHFIMNRMEEIKSRLTKNETDINTAFNELIVKAEEGSARSFSWVVYIFIEKHLKQYAKKNSFHYSPIFNEIHFDAQIDNKLRTLIQDSNSKWRGESFILPILNYMSLNLQPRISSQNLYAFREILERAALFKDSPIRDFKFFWASLVLQYSEEWQKADPLIQSNQKRKDSLSQLEHIMGISAEDKKMAKKAVKELAEDNYRPAQHLLSLIYILERNFDSALPLLEKNKDLFPQSSYILLPLIYRDVKRDIETATALFKTAIYEKKLTVLNPELINIYLPLKKDEETVKLLQEMLDEKNHSAFSEDLLLNSFQLLIYILLDSPNKLPENRYQQAFRYYLKARLFAEQRNISLAGVEDIENKIKSRLSEQEIKRIEHATLKKHKAPNCSPELFSSSLH